MELDFRAIGQRIKIARIKKHLTQDTVSEMGNGKYNSFAHEQCRDR